LFKEPIILSWSGGKDSAYALYKLMNDERYEVKYLLSTFNVNFKRLSMHGVKEELVDAQAESIGISLIKVYVYGNSNGEYEMQMKAALLSIKEEGINKIAFGDIFLEDLKDYRETMMHAVGMECIFPLWKNDTTILVNDFIAKGFKTYTCCINDAYLDESWAGRLVDHSFLQALPATVDPCGENGEFHTFCADGPVFKSAIPIKLSDKIYKPLETAVDTKTKGFWYCDMELLKG
jgi:uncharacterized protein (TIGR00290 family)